MTETVYERGLGIRREVVGEEYVSRAFAATSEFDRPIQDLVTEYCWGAVWGRAGLDRNTRSLLNIAMIAVLNRPQELRAHLRGALANGCTDEQIREVLMQVAVYAGMPAGLDGFRIAKEVLGEHDRG